MAVTWVILTGSWTAAGFRAARTANVTATAVGAALAPAEAHHGEEEESANYDQADKRPFCK